MSYDGPYDKDDLSNYIEEEKTKNTIFKDMALSNPKEDSIFDCFSELSKLISGDETPNKEIVENYIDKISIYFGEDSLDAFDIMVITKILSQQINGCKGVGISYLAKCFNVSVMDLLKRKKNFDKMVRLNFLEITTSNGRKNSASYLLPQYIYNAIISDRPINKNEAKQYTNFTDFIDNLSFLIDTDPPSAVETINYFEDTWANCKAVKKMQEIIPDERFRGILYTLFSNIQIERVDDLPTLSDILNNFFADPIEKKKVIDDFLENRTVLQKMDFIELQIDQFADKTSIEATREAITFFYGDEADGILKKTNSKEMINTKSISEKQLFYSDEMNKVIDTLYQIMDETNFINMQTRLEQKGMKKGVSVILYGNPGTGKTETVLQMAKKTNRNVFHVDISEAKSCWFGESQKKVKLIFTKYKMECKNAIRLKEPIPILLLNEADALISKRKDVSLNGITQEENAIQNVFLEEIENMEGILIATTNIPDNLDSAFERRFLFKLEFEKPELRTRIEIWKNRVMSLKETEIEKLAQDFDFSGGEIDNIVRKIEINEILNGIRPSYEEIHGICEKEKFDYKKEANRIGFFS